MPKVLSPAEIADFRERLIDVAERLFAEQGPAAVSLRQMAVELGVSAMTPYRYFKDKDEILAAVRARGFTRFAEALEAAFDQAGPPERRGVSVGNAYVRFALEHPAAYGLMFDLAQPTEQDHPDLVAAGERARRSMTAYVRALSQAGLIVGDVDLVAHAFWAAIHGLVMLQLSGKLSEGVSFEAVQATLLQALSRGVSPGAGS